MERIINDKKVVVTNLSQQDTIYRISQNEPDNPEYTAQVIAPIVSAGESIGAVILLSKDPECYHG
jgi:AbrB family transcriptional regulator (stage V sporulation protein T)